MEINLEENRQTGRTTRMLKAAVERAKQNNLVTIYARNVDDVKRLDSFLHNTEIFGDIPINVLGRISFLTPASIIGGVTSIVTTKANDPNCFIDHDVAHKRLAKFIDIFNKYNAPEPFHAIIIESK